MFRRSGLMIERPALGEKGIGWGSGILRGGNRTALKQKTFTPGKTENEGIQRIRPAIGGTVWPHPSLDGEVGPVSRDRDEHNQTDILTWGLTSLPPSRAV